MMGKLKTHTHNSKTLIKKRRAYDLPSLAKDDDLLLPEKTEKRQTVKNY